ncbi:8-amino-7-oxononanoate synthase [Sedimenticola thiotaurini]|uniref:8-amino-7-oxononanoate synthase n=1 Tax=Sedimenticola thiotaurini TaxID=1543721 RepID=A0A0F7K148_9GAMM|nr:8-amino-7-oxononanoate synthase [Sedimenticola thiotaurini]AKH20688.1 8-amino-7-oxononanoate synthase [Sedimenticola thiotaurini]
MRPLEPELERRRAEHLYRRRRVLGSPQNPRLQMDGQELLSFCSNDYLGLANHPEVIAALQRGADRYGAGSGSAHLVSGHSQAHHALEEELAAFTGRPRALLYSTGYMANQGVIAALLGRDDTIYQDRLNHASLIDGGLLSRAGLKRYPHNDTAALAARMACQSGGDALVAVDGVFSMDGDLAPLPELATLCERQQAWLMVDDAHGFGVLGRGGRGSVDHFGLDRQSVPILVGTLGKAFGTFGAFVAGSEALIETLIQQSRSYIYTTALPPAVAEATRTSLRLLQQEEWRREQLRQLIAHFRAGATQLGLNLMASQTPIQPILAGSAEQALAWSQALERQGLLVTAIRPPTVPEGSARLRVTLSASHTLEQLDQLLEALARLKREADA